jgi:16S rRNA U516 pseudouridylate synthase RsuA-like enzyme
MAADDSQEKERNEAQIELAQRLAAAYTSYVAGYSGVDYLLKQTREHGDVGEFWKELAEFISLAMAGRLDADSQLKDMVAKYIQ